MEFPWPPREGESAIGAFGRTWQESTFHPSQFFAAMPAEAKFAPALLYALIIGVASTGVRLFWSYVLPGAGAGMTPQERMQHPFAMILHPHYTVTQFLVSPALIALVLLVGACILHLFVMMFVRDRGGFERTFLVMCYSVSPAIFGIVPFAGTLVAGIWSVVLRVIGVREAHRTTTGRASAAVLAPAGCLIIVVLIFTAIVFATLGSAFLSKPPFN